MGIPWETFSIGGMIGFGAGFRFAGCGGICLATGLDSASSSKVLTVCFSIPDSFPGAETLVM